jgi:CarD family transcriptional regulator
MTDGGERSRGLSALAATPLFETSPPGSDASAVADQELRKKVPSKSASAKKLTPVEGADPEIIEAAPVMAAIPDEAPGIVAPGIVAPAVVAPAVVTAEAIIAREPDEPEDDEPEAAPAIVAAAPAPANDSLPPPLPRPQHSFGGGNRSPGGGVPGRMMPPPRPMAKAENFVEGDHVVYPTHGVGKVERIATEEIAGHKLELIHITFEENRMTLRVPVAKARTAGLRKLATRKLFDEALAVLKGRARIKRTMWSRRAQEYEAKINSGDPLSIAEVVRDLHRNAGQPDQSFSERQIYEAAMDRLAAELAALEQIDKMAAATKLVEFLKTV